MEGFFWIIVIIAIYFIPTVVAYRRDCASFSGMFMLNLFLGWTFLGWVGALVWATSGKTDS